MIPDTLKTDDSRLERTTGRRNSFPSRLWDRFFGSVGLEKVFVLLLFLAVPFLALYNLKYNPRPWHDEGSLLSVSRTLTNDGVYAGKTSDGYETFGAVQSVGPTVILPIAAVYKFFGVGLIQGRYVIAVYMILTLLGYFLLSKELFGRTTALLAAFLLLSSQGAEILLMGRKVSGDVPALGFFIFACYFWLRGSNTKNHWLTAAAGLFLGAAIVTKAQYLLMSIGTLVFLALLDLVYFRQRMTGNIIVIGGIAISIWGVWWLWQVNYFGFETFTKNTEKLQLVMSATMGINIRLTIQAIRLLFSQWSGNFYYFWGFFGILYIGLLNFKKKRGNQVLVFLLLFTLVWLAYLVFWINPWPDNYFVPAAIIPTFVSKLCSDLLVNLKSSWGLLWEDIKKIFRGQTIISPLATNVLGSGIAVASLLLMSGYQFQNQVREYVLDKKGNVEINDRTPKEFGYPWEIAEYLDETVPEDTVIETWDRELNILTNHNYHSPDQLNLAMAYGAIYRGKPYNYSLGDEYFQAHKPGLVIIGWFSRFTGIYDEDYLLEHYKLIKVCGDGMWRYDVYQIAAP